jgi:hypothetical protein
MKLYINTTNLRKGFEFTYSNSRYKVYVILTFVTLLTFACTDSESECESRTCADFQTQSEAQIEFNSNPSCYANLDSDSDGIPCENLPN